MTNSVRHRTGLIVLLTYILSGFLVEVTHHDVSDVRFYSAEVVTSHDCGAREMHVSMDKRHDCLACSHLIWRLATAPLSDAVLVNALNPLFMVPANTDGTPQNVHLSHVSRGPPTSVA